MDGPAVAAVEDDGPCCLTLVHDHIAATALIPAQHLAAFCQHLVVKRRLSQQILGQFAPHSIWVKQHAGMHVRDDVESDPVPLLPQYLLT